MERVASTPGAADQTGGSLEAWGCTGGGLPVPDRENPLASSSLLHTRADTQSCGWSLCRRSHVVAREEGSDVGGKRRDRSLIRAVSETSIRQETGCGAWHLGTRTGSPTARFVFCRSCHPTGAIHTGYRHTRCGRPSFLLAGAPPWRSVPSRRELCNPSGPCRGNGRRSGVNDVQTSPEALI